MREKLQQLCEFLNQGLVERECATRLSLLAALAGEHLLLLGPPGTAKSELARKLHRVFREPRYFERLLTRFSVPEELFGPLSIKALEDDRYQRLTERYLPEASIAFIDEVFKANSAILNALLTLLNEREFDNGSERISTPLICVLAASNELPDDDGLQALYDRFLLRYEIGPVGDDSFDALIDLADAPAVDPPAELCLGPEDLAQIQQAASTVELSAEARALIRALRGFLQQQQRYISDRRWRKLIKLLKVAAFTNGQSTVNDWDCSLLIHCLWDQPEQQQELIDWLRNYFQLDVADTLQRLDKLVTTWEQKLADDASRSIHKTDHNNAKLFRTPQGDITTRHEQVSLAERDGEVLYLAPPDQQDRTNQGRGYSLAELEQQFFDDSYKQTHINGHWVDIHNYVNNTQNRLVERIQYEPLTEPCYFSSSYIESAQRDVQHVRDELQQIQQQYESLLQNSKPAIDDHLWLNTGFVHDIMRDTQDLLASLIDYQQRMQGVAQGLSRLPVKMSTAVSL